MVVERQHLRQEEMRDDRRARASRRYTAHTVSGARHEEEGETGKPNEESRSAASNDQRNRAIRQAKRMAATGRTLADRAATRFEHAIGRLVGDSREARQRHVTGDDKPKGGIRGHDQLHRVARDDLGDERGRFRMRVEEGWVATVDLALDFAEGPLAIAQLEDGPPRFAPRG